MQASGREIREFCKNVETEMNRKIFLGTNSLAFIEKIAEAIETHLDKVEENRAAAEIWLEFMEIPSKDDIAAFAINLIKLEQRLDDLEDEVFNIRESIQEYRLKLLELKQQARTLTVDFASIEKK
jgi:predicted  nucleic acid-binding Zn-ribbon protein